MMKLHEHLDELKDRAASGNGDHVPLMTRDVIELIEDRNALYEALCECLNYIENTENWMGEALDCGDAARAALAKARGEA